MTKKDINEVMCKSFFKSGEKTNKREYTRAWVELINRLEKSKCLTSKNKLKNMTSRSICCII